jgi:hypothetical protein
MAGAYAGRKAGEMTANKIGQLYGYGLYYKKNKQIERVIKFLPSSTFVA